MESNHNTYFEETYDLVKKYTDDRLLLLKIQSAKKTAKITSKIVFIFATSVLLFFVLLFVGFMLAYFFAEKLNSTFYGFSVVAGISVFILLLFIALYKIYFSGKVMNMVTHVFFENDLNNTDEDDE
jgi:energy-coupling factor transporter transmembrane protein EcfT